jgi:Ni/Fe-hydrogenase subunit HybB-like protein
MTATIPPPSAGGLQPTAPEDDRTDGRLETILRPLGRPTWRWWATLAVAVAGLAWFAQAWILQLQWGLVVTNMADWGYVGGVPWGFYEGSMIWWIGIGHGGIIVSAAVRLFRIHDFAPIARIAELLTLASLANAGIYIVLHLGRPDRVVTSILPNLPTTLQTSPLAWDVMVITLYFVLTATYLTITLRHDLHRLQGRLPRLFSPLYRVVLVGHRPEERHKAESMAWWLALGLIVLAPLFLHGGVIPWLFALLPGATHWFGPVQGPQFLAAALASALGAVTILAYVLRRVYGWGDIIHEGVFRSLSRWMGLFALLILWLQLQKIVTGLAMAPESVRYSTNAMATTPLYWVAVGMLAVAVAHVGFQMLAPHRFSIARTAVIGALPLVAIGIEKVLFVIEGLMYPQFSPHGAGTYSPSWVEWASLIGAVSLVVLFFLVASKAVPMVELEDEAGPDDRSGCCEEVSA